MLKVVVFTDHYNTDNCLPSLSDITPLTNLQTTNVTGSSFCLSWTSQSQSGLMFLVVLMQGSEVKRTLETNLTFWEVTRVQSGVLYNVIVTPCACGSQGTSLQLHVKTGESHGQKVFSW